MSKAEEGPRLMMREKEEEDKRAVKRKLGVKEFQGGSSLFALRKIFFANVIPHNRMVPGQQDSRERPGKGLQGGLERER